MIRSPLAAIAAALTACSPGTRSDAPTPVYGEVRTEVPACAAAGRRAAAVAVAASTVRASRGTASIDGVLSPGEWDSAEVTTLQANLPASVGGGTAPAEVRFLVDDRNLYASFRLAHPLPTQTIFGASFVLELGRDCARGATDDVLVTSLGYDWSGYSSVFTDAYRMANGWAPADAAPPDGPAGTSDGAGAGGGDASSIVLEMSHPLASGDVAHDLQLAPGDTVPFRISFRVIEGSNEWPYGFGDTDWPGPAAPMALLRLGEGASPSCGEAVPPTPRTVRIDVKPGSSENPVNLGQPGTIPVAILSDLGFDATKVDASTVRFAGAPVATTPQGKLLGSPEDVDGDGLLDLVLHFDVKSLGLASGATSADLEGVQCDGAPFVGTDAVRIVP
jgi:hypothetical protein